MTVGQDREASKYKQLARVSRTPTTPKGNFDQIIRSGMIFYFYLFIIFCLSKNIFMLVLLLSLYLFKLLFSILLLL